MERAAAQRQTLPDKGLGGLLGRSILITGARAPVALHWARLLTQAGHKVWLADTLVAPLARESRLIEGYVRLPSPRFALEAFYDALEAQCARLQIETILPTCEEIFYLAQGRAEGRLQTPLFAPDFETLARAHHKYHFLQTCAEIGLPVPDSQLIETREALLALHPEAHVFKPAWSRFGAQVFIRPRASDLRNLCPSAQQPWLAQEVLEGEEISVFGLAINGQLRALSAYRAGARAGQGASVVFEPVTDPALEASLGRFTAATAWHGQISFDLRRDTQGQLRPIECNPRATSGLHFFCEGRALLKALEGGPLHRPQITAPLGSKLALLIYGRPLRHPKRFAALWRLTKDIHDWPGDNLSIWQQLKGLREILLFSVRQRISPQAASTFDIEWNGPADPLTDQTFPKA